MLAMVNSMLSTLVACAQCQKQHLWALGPLRDPSHSPFSFKNRLSLLGGMRANSLGRTTDQKRNRHQGNSTATVATSHSTGSHTSWGASERPRWGKLWRHGTSTSKPVQGIIHPGQIPTRRRQLGLLTWAAIK